MSGKRTFLEKLEQLWGTPESKDPGRQPHRAHLRAVIKASETWSPTWSFLIWAAGEQSWRVRHAKPVEAVPAGRKMETLTSQRGRTLSLPGLLHLAKRLQIHPHCHKGFLSFLWLHNVPVCVCVCLWLNNISLYTHTHTHTRIHRYILHFLYLLIH